MCHYVTTLHFLVQTEDGGRPERSSFSSVAFLVSTISVFLFSLCAIASSAVNIVSGWLKVQMAHMYMWRPYVERAQTSIWSQYVIFMMNDHAMVRSGLEARNGVAACLAGQLEGASRRIFFG